ncbi:MAG: HD domain-containing protein [Rhodovarius sp.]|nr:HD domain-containing protein [Rhodovarius sp.]MCX7933230.1 HD domain-containing protein [Rhodovarius sp.]MDW8314419.1 HD domain-containing protein [Rhodovarius sp.]
MSARVLEAALFAAEVHARHRRKGAAEEPYINHCLEVAALLAAHGAEEDVVIAGLLHDSVEDSREDPQPVTVALLEERFGPRVAAMVAEVSDDKSLPKEVRKARQITQAREKSEGARLVALADKIANLRAIRRDPPARWPHARQVEYVGWAGRVAEGLRGLNPGLDAAFDAAYREALAELAARG